MSGKRPKYPIPPKSATTSTPPDASVPAEGLRVLSPASATVRSVLATVTEHEHHQAKDYYSQGLKFYRVSFWSAIATATVGCLAFILCVGWLFMPSANELQVQYGQSLQQRDEKRKDLNETQDKLSEKNQQLAAAVGELHVAETSVFGAQELSLPSQTGSANEPTVLDKQISELEQKLKNLELFESVSLFSNAELPPDSIFRPEEWKPIVDRSAMSKFYSSVAASLGRGRIVMLDWDGDQSAPGIIISAPRAGLMQRLPASQEISTQILLNWPSSLQTTDAESAVGPAPSTGVLTSKDRPTEVLTLLWYQSHLETLVTVAQILVEQSQILEVVDANLLDSVSVRGTHSCQGL